MHLAFDKKNLRVEKEFISVPQQHRNAIPEQIGLAVIQRCSFRQKSEYLRFSELVAPARLL